MNNLLSRRPSLPGILLTICALSWTLFPGRNAQGATNRSAYIPYDFPWISGSDYKAIVFDQLHQQIFVVVKALDRIDVLSAAGYDVIQTITVPSPVSVDISPDGHTIAVATSSAHILFFDTGTFVKTNDIVFADSALGVTAFVYAGDGNGIVRAAEGLSTGGGITSYWNHLTNSFTNTSNALRNSGIYQTNGPLARSADYSRILLGDATSGGSVQVIDGATGQIIQQLAFGGYIDALAANKDGSRYAVCVEPAGIAPSFVILDSSFNELYQDEEGCRGMTTSPDGNFLYRDVSIDSTSYTQSFNMTTFATTNTTSYFSLQAGSFSTSWQAADGTGVVYGFNANVSAAPIFVAVDTTLSTTPAIPPVSDPVHIVRVIDNVGSPQGGDLIRILCTGIDKAATGSVSVTIGGANSTNLTVSQIVFSPTLPNLRIVTVKTPPGASGRVDATLNANGTSDTASKGFQYARTVKLFSFSPLPNFLVYDSTRQRLYAARKDEVEVIDVASQTLLAPLVPASGKLPNSQFAGLSLSPDGNRLYIADVGASLIHELDLTVPPNGATFDPSHPAGSSFTLSPARVFEMSSGTLVGSDLGGNAFSLNPATGQTTLLKDQFGNPILGRAWNTTNKGQNVLLTRDIDGLISSSLGLWNATSSEYAAPLGESQWVVEASANEDGTAIAAGGSTPGIQAPNPEIADFQLNTEGFITRHFDAVVPTGTPSFFFHPSGALLYKAGTTPVGGSIQIEDTHQWSAVSTITFPEPFATSYSPFTDHMLTTDDTGRYFFGVTNSGITMMVLDTLPLSVGNVQPNFISPAGGEFLTVRGSGFQPGSVLTIGGAQVSTNFVDENTLTAFAPPLSSGFVDIKVMNPDGGSYVAPGILHVLTAQATPVITGFSPSSASIALSEYPISITILGAGFEGYDTVEIDGLTVPSALTDSSHIQATIPYQLTGTTGPLSFTVVSPYSGPSNSAALQLVNPVPTIHYILPATIATGSSDTNVFLYGINFVAGSVIQWNGQNLATTPVGGLTNAGDELLLFRVPATLLASSGTAAVSVFNPAPAGGLSASISFDVAPAHPVVNYPPSIDFGTILVSTTSTKTIQLQNYGSGNYSASSIIVDSPYAVLSNGCTNVTHVPPGNSCLIQLQFSPIVAAMADTTLTIADNAAGSPHQIPVLGNASQTLIPVVTVLSVNSIGETNFVSVTGTAVVGGPNVAGTAWLEYGTDTSLNTFTKSPSWSFVGDNVMLRGSVSDLSPATAYAIRLVVQTAGGTGKSNIRFFTTIPAPPFLLIGPTPGGSNMATITAGQVATFQLQVSDGGNGYTGTASFTCTGVPVGATCTVSPNLVGVGTNPSPFKVVVTTTGGPSASVDAAPSFFAWAAALLILVAAMLPSRPRWNLGALVCLLVLTFSFSGCGGGAANSSPPSQPLKTPPGSYIITINGTTTGTGTSTGSAQTSFVLILNVS